MLQRDSAVAAWVREWRAGLVALTAGGYSDASPEITAAGFAAMVQVASA